jgi:hypothetical protein
MVNAALKRRLAVAEASEQQRIARVDLLVERRL